MKKFRTTILIVTLVAMLTLIAHATVGSRTAQLSYKDIKITLDGKELIPLGADGTAIEPFIINGTTYLPVRGISSALGLNVEWDGTNNPVKLATPGIFTDAVQVYDDKKVTIEFAGCTVEKPYSWSDTTYYYANFNIKNKTDTELTFQPDSISFNGLSFNSFIGSEAVAPKSTGKISFYTETEIPTSGINKTSGQISVVDFSKSITDNSFSYEAKWVDVTQK